MIVDIVVDTNVLKHAENPQSKKQKEAGELIRYLYENSVDINADTGLMILNEYEAYLHPNSVGFEFVAAMIRAGRLKLLSNSVRLEDRRWIGRNVADTCDRAFLRVACISVEQLLVSHDFQDFPVRKRRQIKTRLGVGIKTAEEFIADII